MVERRISYSDSELVEAYVYHHDSSALGVFFAKERKGLTRSLFGITKDLGLAEDVFQDACVAFMDNAERYVESDSPGHYAALLSRIARNKAFNLVRDRRRRAEILGRKFSYGSSIPATQEESVLGQEVTELVSPALEDLSPRHRDVLKLRFHGEMTYAEIAEALEVKLGTVMSSLSRAKRKLAKTRPDLADLLYV